MYSWDNSRTHYMNPWNNSRKPITIYLYHICMQRSVQLLFPRKEEMQGEELQIKIEEEV